MNTSDLLCRVWRRNKKTIVAVGVFLLAELLLLLPVYGSFFPSALAAFVAVTLAAIILNRYFWIRIFRPLLQLYGAKPISRGGGECCCACFCREPENVKVKIVRAFFVLVYVAIYAVTIGALVTEQTLSTRNGTDPHPFVYFSFQWAGGFMLMIVSTWIVDIFLLVARLLEYWRRRCIRDRYSSGGIEETEAKLEMPKLPLWAFPAMWGLTFIVLVTVSSVQGTQDPVTRTIEVPLESLPQCLDGYKIAMISDIHAGPTVGRPEMERHVAAVNALGADAIVLVGDLVDDQVAEIDSIVDPVSGLSAPDGKYFVQGNHEHYTGNAEEWAAFLTERGFTVLNDTRITLPPGVSSEPGNNGCYFYLAGVDDFESSPDYRAALEGRDNSIATVLLAHEPKQVVEASKWSSVGLHLSGHTHGGQVFPYHVLAYLDQGYVSGLYKKDDTFLYVSEGAVGWGPRMRLLSTTEYTVVILRTPQFFSDPDTSVTESSQATGAAGVLLLMTFMVCLGRPVWKAFRTASEASEGDTRVAQDLPDSRTRNLEH